MSTHRVVSREEWIEIRRQHLAKEKELTRRRDQLSQERRELPWVKVDKPYVFDGPRGRSRWPTSSRADTSSSSTTSCSTRAGRISMEWVRHHDRYEASLIFAKGLSKRS